MTSTTPGVYRGTVVDNVDPQGLGRIRVSVPRVMGESATGWAFPAWTLDDWTIWPEDRVPSTDQGVWIIFESPDKMTWIATYGPQQFSNQSLDDPVSAGDGTYSYTYRTTIAWDFKVLPQDAPTTISGTLSSPSGVPQPAPTVVVQRGPSSTGPWTSTQSTAPVHLDGTWTTSYTRPNGEVNQWYRATYSGSDPFWPVSTDPLQIKDTATTVPWTPPPAAPPSQYWKVPATLTGLLLDANNVPLPSEQVSLLQSDNQTVWSPLATLTTDAQGRWTYSWTRTATAPVYIRARYYGSQTHDSSASSIGTIAAVLVPTTLAWTFPSLVFNVAATITGTLVTNATYGIPPGTVDIYRRIPATTGSWAFWKAITPNPTTGAWSTTVTQTDPSVDYWAGVSTSTPYQTSETPVVTRSVSSATTTTAPVLPATLVHGSGFTATGTVIDSLSRPATVGSCQLWYRFTNGADTAWHPTSAAAVTPNSSGNYSITHPALTVVGPLDWKVEYTGSGAFLSSTSGSVAKSIGLNGMTGLAKDPNWLNLSTGGTYWTAVSGASNYEVTGVGSIQWPTATQVSVGGLAAYTTYTFYVRAMKQDAAGNWVYGGYSSASFNTGRAEQRNANSLGIELAPSITGSWRPSGWGVFGDQVIQGSYGSSGYYDGVMQYDNGGFQNWVRNNYGQQVLDGLQNHSWWTETSVVMQRISGAGYTNGAINLRFNVSDARVNATGGPHWYAGGHIPGSLTDSQGATRFYMPNHWGAHILLNQNVDGHIVQSLMLEYDSNTTYIRCYGKGNGLCNMIVRASWNFQTVSPITPYWL